MESPGGYQLVGRSLPIWNTKQTTQAFAAASWLLRYFDRIQFELVSEAELLKARETMLEGSCDLRIREETFNIQTYKRFIDSVQDEANAFKIKQTKAAERWTKGY